MPEWLEAYGEHEVLGTPEAKEALGKYETAEDALVGGYNASKKFGKPYILPESLEKLPDDKVRGEFTGSVKKMLGIQSVKDKAELDDVNWADGLPDARSVNKDLVEAYIEEAIASGKSFAQVQRDVAFNNKMANQFKLAQAEGRKAQHDEVNTKLEGMYGGKEGVEKYKKDVFKMFATEGGLAGEEVEILADELAKAGLYSNPLLTRALFNLSKVVVKEGETEKGSPPAAKTETIDQRQNRELPDITKALGWTK